MNRRSAGHERSLLVNTSAVPQRRTKSTGKLGAFFGSNAESDSTTALVKGLEELVTSSKLAAKSADMQRHGVQLLARWAHQSRNTAIDDVMNRTAQLFEMYTEKQIQFTRDYEEFIRHLRKIPDTEREVAARQKAVNRLVKEERTLRKRISDKRNRGAFFRSRRSEEYLLQEQHEKICADLERAKRELNEIKAEAEAIKMFHFRRGMMGIADSFRSLASTCQTIFDCHSEITEMVPAPTELDLTQSQYCGMPFTRERVEEVRLSLQGMEINLPYDPPSSRRRSEPPRRYGSSSSANRNGHGTPPPPYSATAPPASELLTPITRPTANEPPVRITPRRVQESGGLRVTPRTNPNRHSASAIPQCPTTPTTTHGNGHHRIYPELPPNPYALLKQYHTANDRAPICINNDI